MKVSGKLTQRTNHEITNLYIQIRILVFLPKKGIDVESKFETKKTTFFLKKDEVCILNKDTKETLLVDEEDLYDFGEWYSEKILIDI